MTMHVDLLMEVNIPMTAKHGDLLDLISKSRASQEKNEAVFKKYADYKESKKLQKMRHELALKENHLVHLQSQSKDKSSMSSLQEDSSHDVEIAVPPSMMDAFAAGYEKAFQQMQKKFDAERQQMSHSTSDSAFFTKSLRATRNSENPHS